CSRFVRLFDMRTVFAALLILAGCAGPSSRPTLDRGLVASPEPHASEVGAAVLRDGGNAVDAAIAVQFALAATFPNAGNLAGGDAQPDRRAGTRRLLPRRDVAAHRRGDEAERRDPLRGGSVLLRGEGSEAHRRILPRAVGGLDGPAILGGHRPPPAPQYDGAA